MKLKSTADGLFARPLSPYETWQAQYAIWAQDNPELSLTTPMPGNTVFEGVEVKFYQYQNVWYRVNFGWQLDFINRNESPVKIKYEAVDEFQERVREEAPIDYTQPRQRKVKASNPELGVESKANLYLINTFFDNDVDPEIIKKVYVDAYLEATQQQGLVRLNEVLEFLQGRLKYVSLSTDAKEELNKTITLLTYVK